METGDLPSVASSNQDQTLHRAVLAGEGARWAPENRRSVGQDHVVRKLPGSFQLEVGAATLVDRVENGLVPGRDRFLAAKVLPSDSDEVSVGGEGLAERLAVGLVPGLFEVSDQFSGDVLCSLSHVFSSTLEISAD